MWRMVPLALLVGCGWSEKKFEVVGIQRLCEQASACAGTYEVRACLDHLRGSDRSACDYDGAAAKDCARDLEEAACEQRAPFDLYELAMPESCTLVWDGCDWIDLSALGDAEG